MNNQTRQIVLNKGCEKYIFRYEDGCQAQLLDSLVAAASNGQTDFDEADDFDSAVNGDAQMAVYTDGFSHQYDDYGDTYADAG